MNPSAENDSDHCGVTALACYPWLCVSPLNPYLTPVLPASRVFDSVMWVDEERINSLLQRVDALVNAQPQRELVTLVEQALAECVFAIGRVVDVEEVIM